MRHVCTRVPKRRNVSLATFTPSSVMDVEVFFCPPRSMTRPGLRANSYDLTREGVA
jgi:hypothetical protein